MKNIDFISIVDGLENIEECIPKPAKNYIPDWFKNFPNSTSPNVRNCPSFPDYFSLGYVLPMWMDSKLNYNLNTKEWMAEGSPQMPLWEAHTNDQFLDHVNASSNGSKVDFIFKAVCPWKIITPPGWSVLQLPMLYDFNKNWSVLPGVIDTDIYHEINQQVMYTGNGEEVKIERGEGFVLYIPFERTKNKLNIRYQNKKDEKKINTVQLDLLTKFVGSGAYRKMQRLRDSK
jgi:hypothetical protein